MSCCFLLGNAPGLAQNSVCRQGGSGGAQGGVGGGATRIQGLEVEAGGIL